LVFVVIAIFCKSSIEVPGPTLLTGQWLSAP
jgi:hypothetical protein